MNPTESFEQALARLDELVQKLERGDAPLEESMKLYEEGVKLAARAEGLLAKAEQRVALLTKNEEGIVAEAPMEGLENDGQAL